MLNSLTLLRTMNGIHEEDVVMAENSYFVEKHVKHFKAKRIITFALAAALMLALGITVYAAGWLAPIFHRMQSMFSIPSKEGESSSEFADVIDQNATNMQERIDLYSDAEQYMNEMQPESETVDLPEFNNSSITLSEKYYNGKELLLGVNLKESVPDIVVGYEPDDDLMGKLSNIAFFWNVKGNDDLDVLLESGMTQEIYDNYLANRTDYAKECDLRHLSAIEFDRMLKKELTPEEYEAAWKALLETGHICVVQSIVYIGDHLRMEDGTDLGPNGQQNMDSNDLDAHSGDIFIEVSHLPAEAQNLDRLDFLLRIKQARVYYYMELGCPAYFFYDLVGESDIPFSVENGA